jgi:hypothetical protein
LSFRTDDVQRWALRVDGTESGSNSGADFQLRRYNDAGAYIDSPIAINRANGNITTAQNINGATPTELGYLSGATSAIQTQLNAKKDTVAFAVMGTIIASPLDSTSYHFGIQPWTPNTTAAFRGFKFTDAGTVEKFAMSLSQTINGSNQTVNIYLRNVTTSTDYSIGTFTSDFGANSTLKTLLSGLSIAVNTTDDWTVKILTPAWTTNPSDWVFGGIISVTK